MTTFDISIVSDTVCPWCYIGYRRLQSAITQHLLKCPDDTFTISWHPFQLNPHATRHQSVDKQVSYERKLGQQQANVVFERLRSAGNDTGINFSFKGKTGNTLDSHRLIEYAGLFGEGSRSDQELPLISLQTSLMERLFEAYFEREQDITSHAGLAAAATAVGMEEAKVLEFLASDDLTEQTKRAADDTRSRGINGVPHFTINDIFTVEGAQEPRAFSMLFDRLKTKGRRSSGALL